MKGNKHGASNVVAEWHKRKIGDMFTKTYEVTYPNGTKEKVRHLGNWLKERGHTQYPARGRKLVRGRWVGFTFMPLT